MHRSIHLSALRAVMLAVLLANVALAQQQGAPAVSTRTYNVADLLWLARDYPLSGVDESGGAGGLPVINPATLISLVQDTVDPESWRDNGGTTGSIRCVSSTLVISQTDSNHEAVGKLLQQLRGADGIIRIANVRATWVLAEPGEIAKPMSEATPEWLARQKIYCESQLTCFSGQTVHISSGQSRYIATDLTSVVGTNAVALDPTIQRSIAGVSLQITPMLTPDNQAVIDVQSSVSESSGDADPITVSAVAAGADGESQRASGTIDRDRALAQQFKTTTRIPQGKKVIVGGMTLDPTNPEQAGRQLYLIIEVESMK